MMEPLKRLKNVIVFTIIGCLFILNLVAQKKEIAAQHFTKKELLHMLASGDEETRDQGLYMLGFYKPECGKSYSSFKEDINILDILLPCSPKNSSEYSFVIFEFPNSYPLSLYGMPGKYKVPDPRGLFEKKSAANRLKLRYSIKFAAFDKEGAVPENISDVKDINFGTLADINGDGTLEAVNSNPVYPRRYYPVPSTLTVSTINKTITPVLSLLYNLDENDWGYMLEDDDGDGVYDIVLGPGLMGDVKREVVFKWNPVSGKYECTQKKIPAHISLVEPGNMATRLKDLDYGRTVVQGRRQCL